MKGLLMCDTLYILNAYIKCIYMTGLLMLLENIDTSCI